MRHREKLIALLCGIITILVGTTISSGIQNNWGLVSVTEVDFYAEDGSKIHSTLQTPQYAASDNQLPGIIVIHGSMASKEWMMGISLELARRGFVVLTIDANGHGNSDPGSGSGSAALEYITSLPYVNSSEIGFIGHSMGGGISQRTINESLTNINALVLYGAGIYAFANTTYPRNILIATGNFDEISSYPQDLSSLEDSFGEVPVINHLYGNFEDGTARKIILPPTDHILEPIHPTIVSETIEWMKFCLKAGAEDSNWIPSNKLIYPLFMFGGLISTLGVIFSAIPVISFILSIPVFEELKKKDEKVQNREEEGMAIYASRSTLWKAGIIYGFLGVGLYLPLLFAGFFIPFPQSRGSSFGIWLLGNGLISGIILFIIIRIRKKPVDSIKKLIPPTLEPRKMLRIIGKSIIVALICTLWIYLWTFIVDEFLAIDFRFYVPIFNDLTLKRLLIAPLYLIFVLPYLYVESIWLTGIMKTKPKETITKTRISRLFNIATIKCLPYLVIVLIKYGGGWLTGLTIFPGMIGFSFGYFYVIIPLIAVSTVFTVWCYEKTNRYILGTLLNGFLFCWIMASILALPI